MAKEKKIFKCTECDNEFGRWLARCPSCKNFDTLKEATVSTVSVERAGLKSSGAITPTKRARNISDLNSHPIVRTKTGIQELDRVLGGGFVDAEVILFAGQPGSGKSTLSLRVAEKYAELGKKVLYSSGEESEQQIGLRAKRMNVSHENILIINETNLETLLGHIQEEKPDFLIVDSLQTIASSEITGSIGSIQQSKEAAHTLTRLAKTSNITMILINQIIKSGEFSGSESIQHIVDAALMLDSDSDTPLKFLRATKNRFGDTTEVGVFQHSESGLEEVLDPGGIFLENDSPDEVTGTSCSFMSEGVRQIPIEIQALVTKSTLPTPRKQFNGVHYNRGQIVCAILDKFCDARLYENDVFVSTVNGVKVIDPLSDLSMAASILSSLKSKSFKERICFVGELGLTGQVRGSFMIDNKIREADRLGFDRIVLPKTSEKSVKYKPKTIKVEYISSVKELLKFFKG